MADEVSGPLVFSCIKCKSIVGDSYSMVLANPEFKTITLSASSNIQRSKDVYTSNEEHDRGSSYFCFVCFQCQQPLGRYYMTTNKEQDKLRDKFTFDIDSISSYELGKAQHGKAPEPEIDEAVVLKRDEVANELAEDVLKIQHVIVDIVSRLCKVEDRVFSEPPVSPFIGHHTHRIPSPIRRPLNHNISSRDDDTRVLGDEKRQRL